MAITLIRVETTSSSFDTRWGGRGRKFKSCHSDQKSVRMHNSCGFFLLILFIFNIFFSFFFFSHLKVHTKYIQPRYVHVFGKVCTNSIRKTSKSLINQGFSALASTFCGGRGLNLRPLLIFAMIKFIGYNSK